MNTLKIARTLAASLGVLAAGAFVAGPAMAFDNVYWSWINHKYENEKIDVDVDIDIDPTGLVQIEKLQIFFGDVKAYANTSYVSNYQNSGQWVTVNSCYRCDKVWVPTPLDGPSQLPEVKTAAAAYGNLQVITSDVPVFLHDAQFVANIDDDEYDYPGLTGLTSSNTYGYGSGNLHTALAFLFIYGAVNGDLEAADITASARTSHILNATVDNSATAFANLISVDLQSDVDGLGANDPPRTCYGSGNYQHCDDPDRLSNHMVEADITQAAFADVTARANVYDVDVYNYKDLGAPLGRPLVNNVATAIGNGVFVNVGPLTPPSP